MGLCKSKLARLILPWRIFDFFDTSGRTPCDIQPPPVPGASEYPAVRPCREPAKCPVPPRRCFDRLFWTLEGHLWR